MSDILEIAFYRGRMRDNPLTRFWDRVVCWVDGSEYSHAEIILEYLPDGSALCASSSIRDGGVRIKAIKFKPGHWDIYPIRGDKARVRAWYQRHYFEDYDWMGLLNTVWKWFPHRSRKWFCTESIAAALGLPKPSRMGPRALAEYARGFMQEKENNE